MQITGINQVQGRLNSKIERSGPCSVIRCYGQIKPRCTCGRLRYGEAKEPLMSQSTPPHVSNILEEISCHVHIKLLMEQTHWSHFKPNRTEQTGPSVPFCAASCQLNSVALEHSGQLLKISVKTVRPQNKRQLKVSGNERRSRHTQGET